MKQLLDQLVANKNRLHTLVLLGCIIKPHPKLMSLFRNKKYQPVLSDLKSIVYNGEARDTDRPSKFGWEYVGRCQFIRGILSVAKPRVLSLGADFRGLLNDDLDETIQATIKDNLSELNALSIGYMASLDDTKGWIDRGSLKRLFQYCPKILRFEWLITNDYSYCEKTDPLQDIDIKDGQRLREVSVNLENAQKMSSLVVKGHFPNLDRFEVCCFANIDFWSKNKMIDLPDSEKAILFCQSGIFNYPHLIDSERDDKKHCKTSAQKIQAYLSEKYSSKRRLEDTEKQLRFFDVQATNIYQKAVQQQHALSDDEEEDEKVDIRPLNNRRFYL